LPKNSRARRTAASLLLVSAAYCLYSLAVVPFIEPPAALSTSDMPQASLAPREYPFDRWFAEDSWERNRPKILATDQGTLLFDDEPSTDGRVLELKRCTLVFYPKSTKPTDQNKPLILRASEGARLFLDAPLDLTRFQTGRLRGGQLNGKVTIDSPPSNDPSADDLHIQTANLRIDENRIWTPEAVEFRFGGSQGRGRHLTIDFEQSGNVRQSRSSPQMGRVKSLEVLHVDEARLHLAGSLFGPDALPGSSPNSTTAPKEQNLVDVSCAGPLRFDFERLVGSLRDRVRVVQASSAGPGDELLCELLELHFSTSQAGSGNSVNSPNTVARPLKLIAEGQPVVIRAPSRNVVAQAQRIIYDLVKRKLHLIDRKSLTLQHDQFTLKTPELEYQLVDGEQIGLFWAAGPGTLDGRFGQRREPVHVAWGGEVRLTAGPEGKVLSIKAADRVSVEPLGGVSADELQLYLSEQPPITPGGAPVVEVNRIQASGNVVVNSATLSARLQGAKIWFKAAAKTASRKPKSPGANGNFLSERPGESPSERPIRFHLDAEQLHAEIIRGDEPIVRRLGVAGGFQLRELTDNNAKPVVVVGDEFTLEDGDTANPTAQLIGIERPARGSLRGLDFVGHKIDIRQSENEIEIPGPGSMKIEPSLESTTDRELPPINVAWTGRMHFDGLRATFEKDVVVNGSQTTKKNEQVDFRGDSQWMELRLNRRISLAHPQIDGQIDLEEVFFRDWVTIEHRLINPNGSQRSFDQMGIFNLSLNQSSGRIHGAGPGWLVHRGPASRLTSQRGQWGQLAQSQPATDTPGLEFLRVDFKKELTGNLHSREMMFHEDVRCLYGPIATWESELNFDLRELMGERDIQLTSGLLRIVEMPPDAIGRTPSLELHAIEDAKIWGRTFAGSGERLSYASAKDQLILAGDGYNDARLSFQETPFSDPSEGFFEKVEFYPGTGVVRANGMRALVAPLD
jgi:hypothetical protein